jgi:hypothetical protein
MNSNTHSKKGNSVALFLDAPVNRSNRPVLNLIHTAKVPTQYIKSYAQLEEGRSN